MRPTVEGVRPVSDDHFAAIERALGVAIPQALRVVVREVNGGSPSPRDVPCETYSGASSVPVYEFARWDQPREYVDLCRTYHNEIGVPRRYLVLATTDADTFFVDLEHAACGSCTSSTSRAGTSRTSGTARWIARGHRWTPSWAASSSTTTSPRSKPQTPNQPTIFVDVVMLSASEGGRNCPYRLTRKRVTCRIWRSTNAKTERPCWRGLGQHGRSPL